MREVTATAEALQFAMDEMGDDDERANKAALTFALLSGPVYIVAKINLTKFVKILASYQYY